MIPMFYEPTEAEHNAYWALNRKNYSLLFFDNRVNFFNPKMELIKSSKQAFPEGQKEEAIFKTALKIYNHYKKHNLI